MVKSRSQNNGEDWKYGIDTVQVLVYPSITDISDLDKWKRNVNSILNDAEVRTGVVNIPGYRAAQPVMAVRISNYEDFLRFQKNVLGKRAKVGTPEALKGALSIDDIFNREEEGEVASCEECGLLGDGFIQINEGDHIDVLEESRKLENDNERLRRNNGELGKHNEKLTVANIEHKSEKVYLKKRINDLSKLVSDEETLRSERDNYLEKANSIEVNLRLAQEPLLRELGLVERITRRIDSVRELLGETNIDELKENIENGEDVYISKKYDILISEIQKIEMSAVAGIELIEGYEQIKAREVTAKKTIEYVNGLAEIFDESGMIIDKNIFREAFRGMPLALAPLAYSTYQTAREGLSDAQKAIEELEELENKYERTKILSEQIKETRNEYRSLLELNKEIDTIVGNERVIPFRLEFLGETKDDYRMKVTIPVLKDQKGLLYDELRLFALSPVLEDKLNGIERVGDGEGELNSYIYKFDKSEIESGEDLALLLYRIGNTMTSLTSQLYFGKLGFELNMDCRFNAGRLISLEEEVVQPVIEVIGPVVEVIEPVVEETVERRIITYDQYVEQLQNRGLRYGLGFDDKEIFNIASGRVKLREFKHLASMELILTMVEKGFIQSGNLKLGAKSSLISNYDWKDTFPEIYKKSHGKWTSRTSHFFNLLVDNELVIRNQEKPFNRFNPGFWIPRESKLLINAQDARDNVSDEVYAKGNILPIGFYLVRNAYHLFGKIKAEEFSSEGLSYDQIWENVLDHRNLSHIICLGDDQQVSEDIFEQTIQDFPRMTKNEFNESYDRLIDREHIFKKGSRYLFNGDLK